MRAAGHVAKARSSIYYVGGEPINSHAAVRRPVPTQGRGVGTTNVHSNALLSERARATPMYCLSKSRRGTI
eukprot:1106211-Alexandrium_andersonii.AAC.1